MTGRGCRWCGQIHAAVCPKVKAIEFAEDGVTVRRVEFFTPSDHMPSLGGQGWLPPALPAPVNPWPTIQPLSMIRPYPVTPPPRTITCMLSPDSARASHQ